MRDHRRYVKRLTKKAVMLMNQMGIEELMDRGLTQASGSQLQRAGICRALMGGPGIIFTDEPIEIVKKENAYRLKTVVFLKYANRI